MNRLERTWQDRTVARARSWADGGFGPEIQPKSHDLSSERFGGAAPLEPSIRRLPEFRPLSSSSPYLFSPPIDFPVADELLDRYRFEPLTRQDEIFCEVLGYALSYRRGDSAKRTYAYEVLIDDLLNKDFFSINEELRSSRAIDLDILARPILSIRLLPRSAALKLNARIDELPISTGRDASLRVHCKRAVPGWAAYFKSHPVIAAPTLRDKLHDERESLMGLFHPLAEM